MADKKDRLSKVLNTLLKITLKDVAPGKAFRYYTKVVM